MNKEDLKGLGIEDEELVQKIIVLHGKDIEKFKSASATFETVEKDLKQQLGEANKTIESFKSMDIEGIKKSAQDWQQKAELASKEAETKVAALKLDYAVDSTISEAKAKNIKAVRALLNLTDVKLNEDGSILGISEQLTKIKSENDYLFEVADSKPKFVIGGQNSSGVGDAILGAARRAAHLDSN